jgi:hypothetical protein
LDPAIFGSGSEGLGDGFESVDRGEGGSERLVDFV